MVAMIIVTKLNMSMLYKLIIIGVNIDVNSRILSPSILEKISHRENIPREEKNGPGNASW